MSIIGLDYGEKRIGVAIAENKGIVLPFCVIENKGRDFVLSELKKIIKEEKVGKIVVGMPLSLAGQAGRKALETQEFVDFAAKNAGVPVESIDERLSSRLADALSGGVKGSRDIGAAMVILEDYLQSHCGFNV